MHIRGMLSDSIKEFLVDPLNLGTKGVIESRTSENKTFHGTVLSYDPKTHSAEILTTPAITDQSGNPRGIVMKCSTDFVGPVSGTGTASAKYAFQPVHVKFENGASTGIFSRGIVGESVFYNDAAPPAYSSWQANPTGTVTVFPAKGNNLGTAKHQDWNSNVSETIIGNQNTENWGNQSSIRAGTTETHLENMIATGVDNFFKAASELKT